MRARAASEASAAKRAKPSRLRYSWGQAADGHVAASPHLVFLDDGLRLVADALIVGVRGRDLHPSALLIAASSVGEIAPKAEACTAS